MLEQTISELNPERINRLEHPGFARGSEARPVLA
jgi:hypothetical protein